MRYIDHVLVEMEQVIISFAVEEQATMTSFTSIRSAPRKSMGYGKKLPRNTSC